MTPSGLSRFRSGWRSISAPEESNQVISPNLIIATVVFRPDAPVTRADEPPVEGELSNLSVAALVVLAGVS